MNLYGLDMDESVSPLEAGLGWTIAWEPADREFIGRASAERMRDNPNRRRFVGLLLEDQGVLRSHQRVIVEGIQKVRPGLRVDAKLAPRPSMQNEGAASSRDASAGTTGAPGETGEAAPTPPAESSSGQPSLEEGEASGKGQDKPQDDSQQTESSAPAESSNEEREAPAVQPESADEQAEER